jgi:hypothetical protein
VVKVLARLAGVKGSRGKSKVGKEGLELVTEGKIAEREDQREKEEDNDTVWE